MKPNNLSHKTIKKIAFGALIFVVFILAAVVMVIVLKNITQKTSSIKQSSASEIITNYSTPKTIAILSTSLYKKLPNMQASIQYKLDDKSYSVNVTTSKTIIFFGTDKSQKNDTTDVQTQTISFLKQKNITKINSTSSVDKTIQYTNFANDTIVCQLTDANPPADTGIFQSHELACEDVSVIKLEYASVDSLLVIYKQTQKLTDFTQVVQDTASESNVSYSVLNITAGTNYYKLLFAAVDNKWSYIGDISISATKHTSSKYNVTPEILSKISNPKYRGFITKNIY